MARRQSGANAWSPRENQGLGRGTRLLARVAPYAHSLREAQSRANARADAKTTPGAEASTWNLGESRGLFEGPAGGCLQNTNWRAWPPDERGSHGRRCL